VRPAIQSSTDSRAVRNSTHTAGGLGAQPAQYLQAAEVRQHDIQHDGVRAELASGAHGAQPVGCRLDVPALIAQRAGHQPGQARLVVDDQNTGSRAVGAPVARLGPGGARPGLVTSPMTLISKACPAGLCGVRGALLWFRTSRFL